MSIKRYDIIDAAEDACKVGYSISVFSLKAFYKVSNLEALKDSWDEYTISRFSQRLEYFIFEHNKLSIEEKKDFYTDLSNNKQNLNYLYEFIDKSRTTIYDLHAKLLARLSVELIKNGQLNYYESNLLSNINQLNDLDLIKIHNELKDKNLEEIKTYIFKISNYQNYCTFNKCLQFAFFEEIMPTKLIQTPSQTRNLMDILPLPGAEMLNIPNTFNTRVPKVEKTIKDKKYKCTEFTKEIFEILDEIIIT
jgi:hypothetical protein